VRNRVDVAIVGAGPAGAATAIRLARAGLVVALLERSRFDTPRVGESLAPSVQPLLVELGAWELFRALQPLPSYGTRSAWGAAAADQHSHLLTPYLSGWHIDRMRFDRMLAEHAAGTGAQLRLGARVSHCAIRADNGFELSIGNARRLRADFVVDASGRGSALAGIFSARHAVFDRLVGIAAQNRDAQAGSHCYTLVETTPDGWWYAAPVAHDRSVAMLMTDGDLARSHGQVTLPLWRGALQRAALTTARIGTIDLHWGPRIFSAVSQRLLRAEQTQRWLAVGDAALAVDPISGSGVVRALRTAAAAASTVLASLTGDSSAIAAYENARNAECSQYLHERIGYYAAEQRWRDAPFWQRRLDALQRLNAAAPADV
jgi:flavin-dependent dehydrogenase